jgi:hypothetical protein
MLVLPQRGQRINSPWLESVKKAHNKMALLLLAFQLEAIR